MIYAAESAKTTVVVFCFRLTDGETEWECRWRPCFLQRLSRISRMINDELYQYCNTTKGTMNVVRRNHRCPMLLIAGHLIVLRQIIPVIIIG